MSGEVSPASAEANSVPGNGSSSSSSSGSSGSSHQLSENVRMFQSIHVLRSRAEEGEGQGEGRGGEEGGGADADADADAVRIREEDSFCLSSVVFASIIGM